MQIEIKEPCPALLPEYIDIKVKARVCDTVCKLVISITVPYFFLYGVIHIQWTS
jgi:hypothetical protein